MTKLIAAAGTAFALLLTPVAVAQPAEAATTVKVKLRTAVKDLPTAAEKRTGYSREKFDHWIDADGDCQDARSEVLRAETKTTVTGRCAVSKGKWVSYYDRKTWTKASDVDVDHMVPLAEAWDSGASKWAPVTRKAYANDLGDKRSLVAVTDNENQAKGDKDPAQWLPKFDRCRYLVEWVAVKIRWSLKVDSKEKTALTKQANGCTNTTITVTKAKIALTTASSGAGSSGSGGNDPRFDTCTEAKAAGYGPYRRDVDPEYGWYRDADNDGNVCE